MFHYCSASYQNFQLEMKVGLNTRSDSFCKMKAQQLAITTRGQGSTKIDQQQTGPFTELVDTTSLLRGGGLPFSFLVNFRQFLRKSFSLDEIGFWQDVFSKKIVSSAIHWLNLSICSFFQPNGLSHFLGYQLLWHCRSWLCVGYHEGWLVSRIPVMSIFLES